MYDTDLAAPQAATVTRPRFWAITMGRIMYFCLFLVIELMLVTLGTVKPVALQPFEWFLLAMSASLLGPAIAYLAIGDWIRFPLTKVVKHSSGVGEDTEPKYGIYDENGHPDPSIPWFYGPLHSIGVLLTCPICAGTWSCAILVTIYSIAPSVGRDMMYVFAGGAFVRLLVRASELLEWAKYKKNEETAYFARINKADSLITK